MANKEHVALLKQGVEVWNAWRKANSDFVPTRGVTLSSAVLTGVLLIKVKAGGENQRHAYLSCTNLSAADLTAADLTGANLTSADLTCADLTGANLTSADLTGAGLFGANLTSADLTGAGLFGANLMYADLTGANLTSADLSYANLSGATLSYTDLSKAKINRTVFGNTNLSNVKGLKTCKHHGPSIIDPQTLQCSGALPLAFLRGVGLPENLIDYLPSLLNQPIQFYSCFISYSSKDQKFADRLHADLQNKGVRCWFAPHDMAIGAKIIDAIDEAIRLRDKVLLILSENSVASDWVEGEVTRSLDEERKRKQIILYPIRVDDAVLNTDEAWARGL